MEPNDELRMTIRHSSFLLATWRLAFLAVSFLPLDSPLPAGILKHGMMSGNGAALRKVKP
jgi:hypothetical protein